MHWNSPTIIIKAPRNSRSEVREAYDAWYAFKWVSAVRATKTPVDR